MLVRTRRLWGWGGPMVLAALFLANGGWPGGAAAAGPLPPLTGPPLAGATRLRLIIGDTPPLILDVDAGTTTAVRGVVPGASTTVGQPQVATAAPAVGGAYVTVWNGRSYTGYFIGVDGSVLRAATGTNLIQARNAAAVWTLSPSSRGRCTLRLEPSSRSPVPAPCGDLLLDSPVGVLISSGRYVVIVDPGTSRVRRRIRAAGQLEPINGINGSFLLHVSGNSQSVPGKLSLIDLATGTQRRLRWPSILPWVQRIAVEPHGPLVAVGFASPAYPGPQQASDVWLLNTTTGTFAHLPGFPAQESIKVSGVAWTSDDRLVLVAESIASIAQGSMRAVIGVWRPGDRTLPLRNVPTLGEAGGYSQFVPVAG